MLQKSGKPTKSRSAGTAIRESYNGQVLRINHHGRLSGIHIRGLRLTQSFGE